VEAGGALVAVAGVLGLTGRWGRRTRFWLPVALAWIGSGSLAALDGLYLVFNRVIGFSIGSPVPRWSLVDTVEVVEVAEVAAGVLAAVVAAALVTGTGRQSRVS
jgi:hypothetical protein